MVNIKIDGLNSDIHESVNLSTVAPYNDPKCEHKFVEEVEDGMVGVKAYRCKNCKVGWLIRQPLDKIKEKE